MNTLIKSNEIFNEGLLIKRKLWKLWGDLDPKILEKFKNINGKTAQYDVPDSLWQRRTSRSNRVLLPWKVILKNELSYEQIETFYGGVCVEFVNNDIFDEKNKNNPLFIKLLEKIGSNEEVSSMLSFRNEDADSSSTIARESYDKFKSLPNNEQRKFSKIIRNTNKKYSGKGDNSVWKGNLFFSIKGGSQTSYESHSNKEKPALFNPATDYANDKICLDIDIVMSYFAIHCFDINKEDIENFDKLKLEMEEYLEKRVYDSGSLLDYCKSHDSLKFGNGCLIDPIELSEISINDFGVGGTAGKDDSVVVSHNESADKKIFYFDKRQNCILSPARPVNFFWSKKLSNMMQQNYNLKEYYKKEEERYLKRKKLL